MSRKHGGNDDEENLAYSCVPWNRYKGADLASRDGRGALVPLFNPHTQNWSDHFRLQGPLIIPLTPAGEVTARLLRFNLAERVVERRMLQTLGEYFSA